MTAIKIKKYFIMIDTNNTDKLERTPYKVYYKYQIYDLYEVIDFKMLFNLINSTRCSSLIPIKNYIITKYEPGCKLELLNKYLANDNCTYCYTEKMYICNTNLCIDNKPQIIATIDDKPIINMYYNCLDEQINELYIKKKMIEELIYCKYNIHVTTVKNPMRFKEFVSQEIIKNECFVLVDNSKYPESNLNTYTLNFTNKTFITEYKHDKPEVTYYNTLTEMYKHIRGFYALMLYHQIR